MKALLIGLALLLALPVLGVMSAWLGLDGGSLDVLQQMADTVLPAYAGQSLLLVIAVAFGVAVVGGATAAAVTLFEFPGRRVFEWALLLPLAMPATCWPMPTPMRCSTAGRCRWGCAH
jgi:iron(III) transport system permease protein